jgi:hypothetical protein
MRDGALTVAIDQVSYISNAVADDLPSAWTEADLDKVLFACAGEPWVDQVLEVVLATLAPLLLARGFGCREPENQTLARQFDNDQATALVMRQFEVIDPMGKVAGRRLQANASIGIMARFGAARPDMADGMWRRNVRAIGTVAVSIGFATATGEALPDAAAPIFSVSLISTGANLEVADVVELTDWWPVICGPAALHDPARPAPQMLPSLMPGLVGKSEEPRTLVQRLEDLVDRCVSEMAP